MNLLCKIESDKRSDLEIYEGSPIEKSKLIDLEYQSYISIHERYDKEVPREFRGFLKSALSRLFKLQKYNEGMVLVLKSNQVILGSCFNEKLHPEAYRINSIWIIPAEQKKGIGSVFLEECIQVLRENGCKSIFLETPEWALTNVNWYHKMGFAAIERLEHQNDIMLKLRMILK